MDAVALEEFVIKSVDAECLRSFCEVYSLLFWPAAFSFGVATFHTRLAVFLYYSTTDHGE